MARHQREHHKSSIDIRDSVKLAFLDSGPPLARTKAFPYPTIFALHGETWYSHSHCVFPQSSRGCSREG
ncbi:hypothetical protein C8Q78DRAFT_1059237 [Trametes maxima]|nr:hypothetical protein C8Q78DRAFT_1059237 [Trametes maxima]